jgi:hypothetical protein
MGITDFPTHHNFHLSALGSVKMNEAAGYSETSEINLKDVD